MFELFTAPENIAFSVSLVMMLGIALLEGVTTLIGFGFSQMLEGLLPDVDAPDVDVDMDVDVDVDVDADIDADADFDSPHLFTRFLGWIKVKGVPMIVLLVTFLTFFSLCGFIIQGLFHRLFTFFLPWYVAIIPALAVSLPIVRVTALGLAKLVMKDETQVVSTETFVGKIAVITLGTARKGSPAEAKLTDHYGTTHYVRVAPDVESEELPQGTEVLLVSKQGHVFAAIKNPNVKLTD